jgi:hypothetical protein
MVLGMVFENAHTGSPLGQKPSRFFNPLMPTRLAASMLRTGASRLRTLLAYHAPPRAVRTRHSFCHLLSALSWKPPVIWQPMQSGMRIGASLGADPDTGL